MSDQFRNPSLPARLLAIAALTTLPVWVGACASGGGGGGGAGGGVTPLPPAPPPAGPPPPPAPPPLIGLPSSFETGEYNQTRGLALISASSAFARGATGAGITVAVIDTGSLQTHPDLTGQFTGPTYDMYPGRDAADIDTGGHGTMVSGVIAARRDNSGIMGVAFESKILDIRADRPGSCAEPGDDGGCSYPVSTVANAINYAVDNGAKIINLSLGGEPDSDQTIENAIIAAAQRGVLIVVSAGNEAEPPTTDEFGNPVAAMGGSPNSPARAAGYANNLGRVVAVGAITASTTPATPDRVVGRMADFSNRAGAQAAGSYILAPGQGVVSTGPDDDIVFPGDPTNDPDTEGDYYRISGTSFAAPYVAGSLALILQSFPNLQATPETALRILLDTADDYVDTNPDPILGIPAGIGTDTVSGVGTLNLRRAFEPQGTPTAFVNEGLVALADLAGAPEGAFGDWAEAGGLYEDMSLIDKYGRTFSFNTDALTRTPKLPLTGLPARASSFAGESRGVRAGNIELSWHTPKLHEDRAAPYQPEPQSQFSATFRFDGGEISTGRGGSLPRIAPQANLVSEPGMPDALSLTGSWASVTQALGPVDIHAFTATDDGLSRYGAGFGKSGPGWDLRTGIESVSDENSALGGSVQSRLGAANEGNLTSWLTEARRDLGNGWELSGGLELGMVELGGVDAAGAQTSRWSIGAERALGNGALSFVLSQPRRAETGTLRFTTVTGADTEGWILSERQISLTPSGRQLNLETRLRWLVLDGWTAETAAALITQPNHVAGAEEAGIVWFGLKGRF